MYSGISISMHQITIRLMVQYLLIVHVLFSYTQCHVEQAAIQGSIDFAVILLKLI